MCCRCGHVEIWCNCLDEFWWFCHLCCFICLRCSHLFLVCLSASLFEITMYSNLFKPRCYCRHQNETLWCCCVYPSSSVQLFNFSTISPIHTLDVMCCTLILWRHGCWCFYVISFKLKVFMVNVYYVCVCSQKQVVYCIKQDAFSILAMIISAAT